MPCGPSCAQEGLDHIVLAGMGGSSLAPEVICATTGVDADGARLDRPWSRPPRPGRPASTGPYSSSPASRVPPSRPTASDGSTSTRSPTRASTGAAASSWSPTPVPRWPSSVRARDTAGCSWPTRTSVAATRPCPRLDSYRPGWPVSTSPSCSTRPTPSWTTSRARPTPTPGWHSVPPSARRTTPAGTRSSSVQETPRSRVSPPGRSSSSPSRPASRAAACCRWTSAAPRAPRPDGPTQAPTSRCVPSDSRSDQPSTASRHRRAARRDVAAVGDGGGDRRSRHRHRSLRPAERRGGQAAGADPARRSAHRRRAATGVDRRRRRGLRRARHPARRPDPWRASSTRCTISCRRPDTLPCRPISTATPMPTPPGSVTCVAARTHLQTTFGWGPRFLHSTGQYHKGGHPNGGFIQITGVVQDDLAIPDRPYTFGELQRAQAAGDARVLAGLGRPVVRLHLTDRQAGLAQLLDAAGKVRTMTDDLLPTGARPQQPPPRPARPPAPPDRRTMRADHLRRDRRPGAQEAHAGRVRPRQPRAAAARLRVGGVRPSRLGKRRLREGRARRGEGARPHAISRGGVEAAS